VQESVQDLGTGGVGIGSSSGGAEIASKSKSRIFGGLKVSSLPQRACIQLLSPVSGASIFSLSPGCRWLVSSPSCIPRDAQRSSILPYQRSLSLVWSGSFQPLKPGFASEFQVPLSSADHARVGRYPILKRTFGLLARRS